jgi:hypothetical protein
MKSSPSVTSASLRLPMTSFASWIARRARE